jgi:oxygen-independent coproporphyrinogen-3 oxidase
VKDAPFALYVHVPYCRHVCPYCDFNVYASAAPPDVEYVRTLATELATWTASSPWTSRPLATVYLGGGTPSLFSPATVAALLDAAVAGPGIVRGAEITLEANPGTVTRERLAAYRSAGVNRISLGVQSFQPAVLRTLGRDHAPADGAIAVQAARAAGIDNVSLDLIFAVPGTSPASWEADLRAAIALAPSHVSAYALTWEEGTPFHAWRKTGRLHAVDEDTEATMAAITASTLEAAGYARYEISSWARPGFASRHNTHYWDGSDYLGLGAGAHSYSSFPAPGRRWANERSPERYRAAVESSGTAVAGQELLTEAQARADFVITGLRRLVGVDAREFERRFAASIESAFPQVAQLIEAALVDRTPTHLRLTPRGLLFADTVSATFL